MPFGDIGSSIGHQAGPTTSGAGASEDLSARLSAVQRGANDEQQAGAGPSARAYIREILVAVQGYVGEADASEATLLSVAEEALALVEASQTSPSPTDAGEAFCAPHLSGAAVVPSLPEPTGETTAEHHLIDRYNETDMGRLEHPSRRGRLLRRRTRVAFG